jgi:Domain of unknown function (DUF5122) beta-propeller
MTLGVTDTGAMLSLRGPSGAGDRDFNGGVPVALPAGSGATAMLVGPDGSVLVGATTAIYRYTPVGLPDPGFGDDGVAELGHLPKPLELLPAAGGDVLALGRVGASTTTLQAVRLAPDGTVDQSLGGSTGIHFKPAFGGGRASPPAGVNRQPLPALAQDSFAVHAVAARPDGSYLVVGGVAVTQPGPTSTQRSIFDFAAAAVGPDFTAVTGFGGPAGRVVLKLGVVPETAASAESHHAITVRLDASAPGLARVTLRSAGHVIADGVSAILKTGPQTTAVGLTSYGTGLLRARSDVHVVASATARDLVVQRSRASASGTLS